ncbi:MAG TPA: C40 family peptidase [Gemmatimonadales bacterium]|nr:C40 family peptidase [Gemmatimonadales bacterium]
MRRNDVGILITVLCVAATPVAAQGEIEFRYGRWYRGGHGATYEFRSHSPLTGVVSQTFGATVLVNDRLGRRQAFYGGGWEAHLFRGSYTFGPYALLGVALGLSTDTSKQALAALWSVGGGLEWRPFDRFALGIEGRYRDEDRGPRGFWAGGGSPRKGFSLSLGLAIGLGGHGGGMAERSAAVQGAPAVPAVENTPVPSNAPPQPPATISGSAAGVVQTALDVLGTPYQWGGTAANGFDCSGLIQYAYGQHGVRLPRISRDQAHAGTEVPPVVEALQPGDILLFSASPGAGVTHVGMYVGEGKFIHSASGGVKISRLDRSDSDGAYWIPRWVGARRILP